jgi:hypothetical protein
MWQTCSNVLLLLYHVHAGGALVKVPWALKNSQGLLFGLRKKKATAMQLQSLVGRGFFPQRPAI